MEDIKTFGDPDSLLSEEDLIILKLDKPCSQPLPGGLTADPTGHIVSMNQEDFTSCKEFLGNQRISAALFAGCPAFNSFTSFEQAAEVILKNVRTLAVLHNRNLIPDLYCKSERLKSLLLFHNLRIEVEDDSSRKPLKYRSSELTKLVGTTPALGMNHLLIFSNIERHCPNLTWIQAPVELYSSMQLAYPFGLVEPCYRVRKHEILGIRAETLGGAISMIDDATPYTLSFMRKLFPRVKRLEVTTSNPDSLLMISELDCVDRLCMTGAFKSCRFDRYALRPLKKFRLKELALSNFENVQLSLVASLCRGLESLSLERCTIDDEAAFGDGFPRLSYLRFRCVISKKLLREILLKCRNLVTLQLDRENIGAFVKLAPKLGLHKLDRLVLDTGRPISKLGIVTRDLRLLTTSLPSLRYLATDSYDVRLFLETHVVHVTLA